MIGSVSTCGTDVVPCFLNVTRGANNTTVASHTGTVNSIVASSQTGIPVASSTAFAVGDYISIDSETMLITAIPDATHFTVTRGQNAATHTVGASVTAPILTTSQTTIAVAATGSFAADDYIKVDSETMQIISISGPDTHHFVVARGATPATHASGATVAALVATTNQTIIPVANNASLAVSDYIGVDSETMQIVVKVGTTHLSVARAQANTQAATHASGATVTDLTWTTGATSLTVGSGTGAGFVSGDYIQIDAEIMKLSSVGSTTLGVTRAQLGTTASTHTSHATVSDLTVPNTSSLYFSFGTNSATGALCNGATGVGCGVKLTQLGLK
ncbi:MAG: hypothetical protein DMF90_11075 [Acidobacteria bacterium]|nr:MAG: hypothetical protein DMF90_11075 [Acidobacteriota bacterium]